MTQEVKLEVAGLWTFPNPFGSDGTSVPAGALEIADDIVVDRENLAEPRRGNKQYGAALANTPHKLFNYLDDILLHADAQLFLDNGNGSFSAISGAPFSPPDPNVFCQSLQSNKNFYLTTNVGVIKLDNSSGSLVQAGAPRGLDLQAITSGATGPIVNDTAVAYRVVWGYDDNNGNRILGAPSPRVVVTNVGGTNVNVALTTSVPQGVSVGWFLQVYRSLMTANATIVPDDEMQLAGTAYYTSGNVVSYTDTTPENMLGASLYTNQTQDGPLQENNPPPYSYDLCSFNDMTLYARTRQAHTAVLTFAEIPANATTVNIDGVAYTANTTENIAARHFQIYAGDIASTAKSLTKCVNRDPSPGNVQAFYAEGGSIAIERVDFGAAFTVNTNSATLFFQSMPATSLNDAANNRVYISKDGRPEAVPMLQYKDLGRADKSILRILSVRDAVFVLKEDGIWRGTGTLPDNFSWEQHDTTYEVLAPEAAATIENDVVCLTTKGVVAVSVSGVALVSRPIEDKLRKILPNSYTKTHAWCRAYTSDKKFLLGLPADQAATSATIVYVFNTHTKAWYNYRIAATNALVNEGDDKLYLVRTIDKQILQERKSGTSNDYADDEFAVTITGSSGYDVTLVDANAAVVGMTLKQGNYKGVVVAKDTNTITLDTDTMTWANTDATLYTPIDARIRWVEQHAGAPGLVKMFPEMTIFFENTAFRNINLNLKTNFTPTRRLTVLSADPQSKWGRFSWGRVGWGSGMGGRAAIRTFPARDFARCLWISVEVQLKHAFNAFALAGAALTWYPVSSRFK